MIDKLNLVLHEKRKNVKKYQECLGNTFYYNYEIMIDINGNVLIEKTTDTTQESNYQPKKETLIEINHGTGIHSIILEVYKEILSTTYDLLQDPLEEQLIRIVNLKNTDLLLVKLFEDELEQCRNKMNNYKRQSELTKELLKSYQTKIQDLKQLIEANKNIHDHEIQKLMETISNVYRHL